MKFTECQRAFLLDCHSKGPQRVYRSSTAASLERRLLVFIGRDPEGLMAYRTAYLTAAGRIAVKQLLDAQAAQTQGS